MFFAVMDFTSGFHQTTLDASCRAFTAFWTAEGVYQWIRVPMGLKDPPKYFQQVMQQVLGAELHKSCELYLDDCIIFGKTEE